MKTIDFSHFIERYNAGEMNIAERQWFEKEIEGNERLRNEVNLRKKTDMLLKNQNIISLRNKLSDIEKRRKEAAVPVKNARKHAYTRYAAVIAVVLLAGGALLFTGKAPDRDNLVSRYYKPYDPPAAQRSGRAPDNADFTLALEFYNTHDYANAAVFFNKVLASNPGDMQAEILNGVSNFEEKKYPEAKSSFVKVITDNNNLFIETAKWYLALCYINTNEKEKALSQLKTIIKEGGIYAADAKKISKKLK
jgi:TolA-binding protein